MFSFVRRLLKRGEKKDEAAEETEEVVEAEKVTPYSQTFEGADQIVISAVDCARKNVAAVEHHVIRPEEILKIVKLLGDLPTEGIKKNDMNPCHEHTLIAYQSGEPLAKVQFYEGELKLENELFVGSDEKALKKQAELFKLIEISLK